MMINSQFGDEFVVDSILEQVAMVEKYQGARELHAKLS